MITKLQTFFLKHNKWLFGGLLIVIIVTFVLTIGPQSIFDGGRGTERRELKYFGYNLSSEADQRTLAYNAEISAMLSPEMGIRRDQLMDYAYMRAAGLGVAEQLGIPRPTDPQLEAFVRSKRIFADPQSGEFSPETYNQMVEMLKTNTQFNEATLVRVLREDYRITQVRKALAGPSAEQPFAIRKSYINNETEYKVQLARLPYDSFEPEVEPSEEDIEDFYESNPARYEVPEKISVDALFFLASSWIAQVPEPAEDFLEAYFSRNKSRYEANREPAAEGEEKEELTLAEVREQVVNDFKRDEARKISEAKSEEFSVKVWENGIEQGSPEYNALIEQYRIQVQAVPAYSRNQPASLPNVPRNLLQNMWVYSSGSRWFSDIGQNRDGAVVLAFKEVIPSSQPELEEVREQVIANWKTQEKRRLFSERGEEIYAGLKAALQEGTAFESAADEFGLSVETTESFSGAEPPPSLRNNPVWNQVRYLDSGELTRMSIDASNGTFAYLESKTVPDVDFDSEEFAEFSGQDQNDFSEAIGWSRLREITDKALAQLFPPAETES